MREQVSAWLRPPVLLALIVSIYGCAISLRGAANPGGTFATPTAFVAGGPPTVAIASPANGQAFGTGDIVYVDVRGTDAYPVGVARLELFAAGGLVDRVLAGGGASQQVFASVLEWTPSAPGTFTLSAYAYRADGTASAPATVSIIISGQAVAPSATPTIVPLPTDTGVPSASPTDIPTVTLSPSPPPTPTPPPTPRPTPSPTPAPIGVHIDVWVEPADLPNWIVGVRSIMNVHVQNIGANAVPYIRLTATLAGDSFRARTGSLSPGQETVVAVALTPQTAGQFLTLSVAGHLPLGYFDTDPQSNTLVWDTQVTVSPGATPVPTASPSPGVPTQAP